MSLTKSRACMWSPCPWYSIGILSLPFCIRIPRTRSIYQQCSCVNYSYWIYVEHAFGRWCWEMLAVGPILTDYNVSLVGRSNTFLELWSGQIISLTISFTQWRTNNNNKIHAFFIKYWMLPVLTAHTNKEMFLVQRGCWYHHNMKSCNCLNKGARTDGMLQITSTHETRTRPYPDCETILEAVDTCACTAQ